MVSVVIESRRMSGPRKRAHVLIVEIGLLVAAAIVIASRAEPQVAGFALLVAGITALAVALLPRRTGSPPPSLD